MKIAITSLGESLDSNVSPTFGMSPYILIVEVKDNEYKIVKVIRNPYLPMGGRGIVLANEVLKENVDILIVGGIGGNAYYLLKSKGIKILNGFGYSVKEAIEKALKNELPEAPVRGRWGWR